MRHEFTATVERDGEWYVAYCREVAGANGQGRTREEALESLREAIQLVLDGSTDLPEGTVVDLVIDDEGDDLDPAEREALERAITAAARSLEQGRGRPAEEVFGRPSDDG